MWKGKHARSKLRNLQQKSQPGGYSLPNFKFLALSFCKLINCCISGDTNYEIAAERSLVVPIPLNILFTHLLIRQCRLKYGPVIAYTISTWRNMEKVFKWKSKWHASTPISNYSALCSGGTPFLPEQWHNAGIHCLGDDMNVNGLRTCEDLRKALLHLLSTWP